MQTPWRGELQALVRSNLVAASIVDTTESPAYNLCIGIPISWRIDEPT